MYIYLYIYTYTPTYTPTNRSINRSRTNLLAVVPPLAHERVGETLHDGALLTTGVWFRVYWGLELIDRALLNNDDSRGVAWGLGLMGHCRTLTTRAGCGGVQGVIQG